MNINMSVYKLEHWIDVFTFVNTATTNIVHLFSGDRQYGQYDYYESENTS